MESVPASVQLKLGRKPNPRRCRATDYSPQVGESGNLGNDARPTPCGVTVVPSDSCREIPFAPGTARIAIQGPVVRRSGSRADDAPLVRSSAAPGLRPRYVLPTIRQRRLFRESDAIEPSALHRVPKGVSFTNAVFIPRFAHRKPDRTPRSADAIPRNGPRKSDCGENFPTGNSD